MAKTVRVTPAQVRAARMLMDIAKEEGTEVPADVAKVANARIALPEEVDAASPAAGADLAGVRPDSRGLLSFYESPRYRSPGPGFLLSDSFLSASNPMSGPRLELHWVDASDQREIVTIIELPAERGHLSEAFKAATSAIDDKLKELDGREPSEPVVIDLRDLGSENKD